MLQVKMPEAFKMNFLDVPSPEPAADEVLIRMKSVGVCGSDIQVYHGRHKYMKFPVVQGHEGAGVVEKIGAGVTDFRPGDRVTVQPQVFCGECEPCRTGHINVCKNLKVYGVHTDGMLAEYFVAPASKVIALPDTMSFDEGALVEPAAVAAGAIRRCGDLSGMNVIVLGAGAIGNLTAQVARLSAAKKVVITDVNSTRLDIAKASGLPFAVNTAGRALKDVIHEAFGDAGADFIIDCAGVKALFAETVAAARCASKIVIVANYKEPLELEMPLLQRREIDMLGIMMYLREDFLRVIDLMANKTLDISHLISNHFGIREMESVYPYIDSHPDSVMKVIVNV